MVTILNDAYGLTEQEIRSSTDHRLILVARDAMRWQKLQKSKPATLNKVRAAPKLIKPGSQQSRTATEGLQFKKGQDNLRRTGKIQDATPLLKKLLFN
jgi:2,3-bisphosphoglycerate-independent phosphoglycerate mutase